MVFGDDPARLGVPRYRLLICAEKPGLISTLSGFKIQVDHGFDALEQADTICWQFSARPPRSDSIS